MVYSKWLAFRIMSEILNVFQTPERSQESHAKQEVELAPVPTFHIGDVPVHGEIIFAPMAGYADVPTRTIYRSFGSALQYTEFVAADDIISGSPKVKKLLDHSFEEQPMVFQIFGNDAQSLLEAALIAEDQKPQIVDINMGCSTRRVSRSGSGVAMMKDLDLIEKTFSLLSKHLHVPVTAKLRLGWEDNKNFIEVGRVLEGCGAAALTLHPRTKEQKYNGYARWEAIAELKKAVSIPVIGNGDINTPLHIDDMFGSTGCDAVMIGRGAIGNPWIMSRLDRDALFLEDVTRCVRRHCNLMQDYYGTLGLTLFRKHLKRYFANMPDLGLIVKQLIQIECPPQFNRLLTQIEESFGGSLVGELIN